MALHGAVMSFLPLSFDDTGRATQYAKLKELMTALGLGGEMPATFDQLESGRRMAGGQFRLSHRWGELEGRTYLNVYFQALPRWSGGKLVRTDLTPLLGGLRAYLSAFPKATTDDVPAECVPGECWHLGDGVWLIGRFEGRSPGEWAGVARLPIEEEEEES